MFLHHLALAIKKSLEEIEALSGHELDRWKAYHAIEPITPPNWMPAQICAVTSNTMRSKGPAAKLEDFLPRVRSRGHRQSTQEMEAAMRAVIGRGK